MVAVKNKDIFLPDYLDHGLRILSVGLNPSIPSAKLGFYFANPRNRFWKAFNQANIINEHVAPNKNIHKQLLEQHGIGFTDVSKGASAGGHASRAADSKQGAALL